MSRRVTSVRNDYPTPDETGVRDYIHVTDLMRAHVAAVRRLMENASVEHTVINIGTECGHSALELVRAFQPANNRVIQYDAIERRAGDVATSYACVAFAREHLKWSAEHDLLRMCEDASRWESSNTTNAS